MLFEEFNEELYKQAAIDDAKASYNDGFENGFEDGEKNGKKEANLLVIQNALSLNLSVEDIIKLTSLSKEEVEEIISSLNK